MTNTDPVKNSEWERHTDQDAEYCPKCDYALVLEATDDEHPRVWICYNCQYTRGEK